MNLANWFAMIEFCLKNSHRNDWVGIAKTYYDVKIMSKINCLRV